MNEPLRVAVLIPTLGRPERVATMWTDVLAASPEGVHCYFIAERGDDATITAVAEHPFARLIINNRAASYAGAINTGLAKTDEPVLFCGADDLHFHPGWLEAALPLLADYGLVGTNDLANPDVLAGRHATHYLVRRDYAIRGCVDAPGCLLHEGYTHNYTDTEAVQTAMARNQFVACLESVVEHNHWVWGKAQIDPTYAKGRDSCAADDARFRARQHLWRT